MAAGADARGDKFDFEFRSPDQVPNAFDTILKATRARHRWSGDLLSAVRDEARAIPQLLLTDREIVRGSLYGQLGPELRGSGGRGPSRISRPGHLGAG